MWGQWKPSYSKVVYRQFKRGEAGAPAKMKFLWVLTGDGVTLIKI